MSKINSNSKGRHRPRHGGSNGGGQRMNGAPVSRNAVFDSNGPCGKIRGNVSQIIEKYQAAAKDALTHSEYVLAELCLQYADHYNRISLSFSPDPQIKPRREETEKTAEPEIDITNVDLSIPDFSIIKNSEDKLAVENV